MVDSKEDLPEKNRVILHGRVSKRGNLKYTPRGVAICEVTLAVPQNYVGGNNTGYFELVMAGELALRAVDKLRVGKMVRCEGNLWNREFKDRRGHRVRETKIVLANFEEGENR